MKLGSLVAGSAFVALLTASVEAQVLTGADTTEILEAAKAHGTAELITQSNGDPQISGNIDGVAYHIYFRNCTDNANCEDLNFYLGFLDLKPGLEKINEWNVSKRFSRAYLDSDEDACVEMDLDLVQGVSAEYLDSQFVLWAMVVNEYSEYVGYK